MASLLSDRHVLVVEDEVLILMMMEGMLADLGCEAVSCAATSERAVALIETNTFDAALLDMNLHGFDSRDVADALARRGVPFIYATGNGGPEMRNGFNGRDVLRKPFGLAEMEAGLSRLLED